MARTPLLTPAAAAAQLGVSVWTLHDWRGDTRRTGIQTGPRWVELGDGPKGRIRYKQVEVDRYIDACEAGAA